MREVAVHLDYELGAFGERSAEAGEIRRPEPLLSLAVENVDAVELVGEPVGELAGPVR